MTEQERLALVKHLEDQIRKFEIVAVGAIIEGGFGLLPTSKHKDSPKIEHLRPRVDNIEFAISEFRLHSTDVDVSGNFEDGYTLA